MEIEAFIGFSTLLFFTIMISGIVLHKAKPEKPNYKNISQMAQNLSICKVSVRQTVLSELYEDDDWSTAEVDELKSVLEGMLDTRITINKSGERKGLTARTRNDG